MKFPKEIQIKNKRIIYLLFLFIIITSCNKPPQSSDFCVKLDLIIKKNDSIHTYFMTDGTIFFVEPKSFWTKIKGNKKNQNIQIIFPKGILIGAITSFKLIETEDVYNINVELFNDMTNMGHVHVINNKDSNEILCVPRRKSEFDR